MELNFSLLAAILAINARSVACIAWKVMKEGIGTYLRCKVFKFSALEGIVFCEYPFHLVGKNVKLDAVVLEIVAWAFESIVLVDADFLLLTRAVHEDAAEHYHTLSDRDVDEERADHAKPSFMRS